MRSYEFGWLLWSFGARTDYPELTERAEFGWNDAQSNGAVLHRREQGRNSDSLGGSIKREVSTSV